VRFGLVEQFAGGDLAEVLEVGQFFLLYGRVVRKHQVRNQRRTA